MGFLPFHAVLSALRASHFLLLRQKKVSKEKATPGYAVGCADFPALLATGGGCGTRPSGPQTVLALFPPAAPLLGASHGDPKSVPEPAVTQFFDCCGRLRKNPKNHSSQSSPDVFPGPLKGAEQRRNAGGLRRALSEGRSPELRSRPAFRVAQGIPEGDTDPGVAFSLATFFWPPKRKYARQQGGTPSQPSGTIANNPQNA